MGVTIFDSFSKRLTHDFRTKFEISSSIVFLFKLTKTGFKRPFIIILILGGGHIEFCLRGKFMPWSQKLKFSVCVFFLLAYFWGGLNWSRKDV